MSPITFRNSRIVYYGPHACENCGVLIVKMGTEWGGTAFTNPEGPIYPNTEWHPHVCDPALVKKRLGLAAAGRLLDDFPNANAFKVGEMGFVILGEHIREDDTRGGVYLVVSANHTFYDSEDAAWCGALDRVKSGNPSWHIDLSKYNQNSRFGAELESLPECPP